MKKINLYVFIQIFKSCTLVFFIFTSIAWLLQITRLFSYLTSFNLGFNKILYLSLFIIPNLINVIMPFILIFGLALTFIKMDRDKEIIAIFSLGLSIKEILKPLLIISFIFISLYLILNLFLSPYFYEKYKLKEHNLRNIININSINFTNFLKLDKELILDFTKEKDKFENIFINFKDKEADNIIYSKKGDIEEYENYYVFNLIDGYKLKIKENEIEKLEFKKYKINFPTNKDNKYTNFDKNTYTIFELINQRNYKNMQEKIFDVLSLISLLILFYFYLIKENKFNLKKISIYLIIAIIVLIFHNLIKNFPLDYKKLTFFYIFNINFIFILLFPHFKKLK